MKEIMLVNKNIIKALTVVAAVVAAMLCLCACGGDDKKPKQKLDTPQNICVQTADGFGFAWDEVLLSDYYTVDINGKQYKVTDACVNVKEVGAVAASFAVKVMANCSDSDYVNSDWSKEYNVTITGYSLDMLPDGSGYEVTDGKKVKGNLCILPSYDGKPILKIGSRAFENNTALTGIILPEQLQKIGGFAFKGCSNLTSVHIPQDVESVDNSIFRECESLVELTVDTLNRRYRSEGNCIIQQSNNRIVAGCAGSVIPDDVDSIYSNAFQFVYGLKSITVPSNIKEIDSSTFSMCRDLENVVISAGVESIHSRAFDGAGLKTITVEDDNPVYRSENNCIIQGGTLVIGCAGSTIPSSVTVIGENAFKLVTLENLVIPSSVVKIEKMAFTQTALGDIVIPSTVESIGEYAFYGSKVKSVVIENGVKSIGSYAFGECPNLERVYVPTSVTSIGEFAFVPYSDPFAGGLTTVAIYTFAPTVFSENVNADSDVDINATSAYYHSENCELEVENNYPYVVSYQVKKKIKGLIYGEYDNLELMPIFDATDKSKGYSPYRMGYTFGGWAIERSGTTAITSENTVDDLETFTVDGEEYVRVYAIWHKD